MFWHSKHTFFCGKDPFCHEKTFVVWQNTSFVATKLFCYEKYNFVTTNVLAQQAYFFFAEKTCFVMERLLSRQKRYLRQLLPMIGDGGTLRRLSCIPCFLFAFVRKVLPACLREVACWSECLNPLRAAFSRLTGARCRVVALVLAVGHCSLTPTERLSTSMDVGWGRRSPLKWTRLTRCKSPVLLSLDKLQHQNIITASISPVNHFLLFLHSEHRMDVWIKSIFCNQMYITSTVGIVVFCFSIFSLEPTAWCVLLHDLCVSVMCVIDWSLCLCDVWVWALCLIDVSLRLTDLWVWLMCGVCLLDLYVQLMCVSVWHARQLDVCVRVCVCVCDLCVHQLDLCVRLCVFIWCLCRKMMFVLQRMMCVYLVCVQKGDLCTAKNDVCLLDVCAERWSLCCKLAARLRQTTVTFAWERGQTTAVFCFSTVVTGSVTLVHSRLTSSNAGYV